MEPLSVSIPLMYISTYISIIAAVWKVLIHENGKLALIDLEAVHLEELFITAEA